LFAYKDWYLLIDEASKILMVDIDQPRCEAQVLDISDAAFIHDCKIRVGTFQEAGQSDIIIVTAGAKQKPGEPRTGLIERNKRILNSCIEGMKPLNSKAVLILVANPVDVLTSLAQKLSGLSPHQVIGTGTFLDTARLRATLSDKLDIAETAIHAYVLGEHGDSQFVNWSSAHIGNYPLLKYPGIKDLDLEDIATETMKKAYKIIEAKGSTYYGIGGVTASLVATILGNTKQIRPVSHFIPEFGCCISMPACIGRCGIIRTIPCSFDAEERKKLEYSATSLKKILQEFTE
jgi:L-lactate dehydrogenase